MWRLPVAPRPYPDELLSSWLGRVACRYGLRADELAGRLAGPGALDLYAAPIDDMAPSADETRRWARVCRVDPERLRRLALTRRYPDRPRSWFGHEGPEWRPSPGSAPACFACFDADRADGRDAYLRAAWTLGERCVCPLHGRLLTDRCPYGCGRLQVGFRLHDGRARPVCARCGRNLAGGAGEGGRPQGQAVIEAVLHMERRIADRVDSGRSLGVEAAIAALWAPLDHPSAARPVLALWFEESGWRCPFEARHAVGARAPLAVLPICWRVVTLAVLQDVYGAGLMIDGATPAADRLARRAAPQARPTGWRPERRPPGVRPLERPAADYRRMAREILAHPEWIAAAALPRRKGARVRGGLIDEALATGTVAVGCGRAPSSRRARSRVRVGIDETACLERKS